MKVNAGFTLVELLVASLLVALAVASALTLVAQGRRAHRTAEARARLEDSARAALDLLSHEVRLAGYLGRLPPGSAVIGSARAGSAAPAGLGAGGGCVESLALDFERPLDGGDGAYVLDGPLALGCPPSPGGRIVEGSDVLVLRRASVTQVRPAAGRLQLETTRQAGRLMTDGSTRLGPDAAVHDVEVSVFYVSADSTGAAGRPSLRRKRLVGGTAPSFQDEELVSGIGDLQVEVEVAPREGAAAGPDGYLPLGAVPGTARTLRVWILAQGDLADGADASRPALAYANREWPAVSSRFARLSAGRVVEPRNAGARR